jgi:aryl-alcohol dehydrogenase-like predicted oxidoreductase/catechol 2,3-dioxygenase-like lactoylglutathione lyase family enzyme
VIKNRGLRHLALRVSDVDRATEFYCRVFGMEVVWRPDAENAYLSSGYDNLALHRGDAGDRSAQALDHLGFIVPTIADVEAGYAWAQANAIDIATPLKHHRDGSVSFYIRDPDGDIVQLLYEPSISPLNISSTTGPESEAREEPPMLKHAATTEATASFAGRFPELPGNFRETLGLAISSIGIGTYLGESDDGTDTAYEDALRTALAGGINLIDTAVNYRFQRSERVIGKVLAELVGAGKIRREEIVVATKGGYITFDREMPANPRQWFEDTYVKPGIVAAEDLIDGAHCMTPRWLAAMIDLSRANLGLETLDIYYLHNPESQLAAVRREDFNAHLRAAFELFERKVSDGRIRWYGVATWNGFRVAPTDRSYLSLTEMVKIAVEAGGKDHHFRVVQLPYNLAMPEAFTAKNQQLPDGTAGSLLAAADATGVAVCASASLLQGRLTRGMPAILADAFAGFDSDAQRALQFVRSTPGINVALAGMSSAAHVTHNLATARRPPASFEALMKLFKHAQ